MMRLTERGFSNVMAVGALLLAVCSLFIYHGLKGTDRGDVSQPIVAPVPVAAAEPQPAPQTTQQAAEPTPEAASPAPTVDAALYEKLESAVAEGRNIVGNARSRASRLVDTAPQQSTPEWVRLLGALSDNLSAYNQLLTEVRRGVAIDDPAGPTIQALQSMLAGMSEITGLSNIPAASAWEARFVQAEQHLNAAWEALQKTQ